MKDELIFEILIVLQGIDAKLEKLLAFYMAANNIITVGTSSETHENDPGFFTYTNTKTGNGVKP